jgi:archaellum component FlaC
MPAISTFKHYTKNLSVLCLLITFACGSKEGTSSLYQSEMAAAPEQDQLAKQASGPEPASVERKLIKTGSLIFETSNLTETKAGIEALCRQLGGYISSENMDSFGDRVQHNLTIRVPAARYDSLANQIEKLALRIENKNVNIQDVTEEFVDVEARLKTKKALEARFTEILKQAKNVEEILSIENQLATVRADIESMEGRLKYLSNQVALSTLSVSYYQLVANDYGFATKFIRGMGQGWQNLLAFIIVLVNGWPFILGGVGIFWLIRRWRKRS